MRVQVPFVGLGRDSDFIQGYRIGILARFFDTADRRIVTGKGFFVRNSGVRAAVGVFSPRLFALHNDPVRPQVTILDGLPEKAAGVSRVLARDADALLAQGAEGNRVGGDRHVPEARIEVGASEEGEDRRGLYRVPGDVDFYEIEKIHEVSPVSRCRGFGPPPPAPPGPERSAKAEMA